MIEMPYDRKSVRKFLNEFINYIAHQKNYSTHTVSAYRIDLRQFLDFIKYDLDSVDIELMRKYLYHLKNNNYKPRSTGRKIAAIKSFFNFLVKREMIKKNPVLLVSSPKLPERLPSFLTYDEVEKNTWSSQQER